VPLPAQHGEVERSLHVRAAVDDADAGVEVGPLLEDVAVEPNRERTRGSRRS
jgi:hypothetical protein